jgi:hypothetical protein
MKTAMMSVRKSVLAAAGRKGFMNDWDLGDRALGRSNCYS